MHMECFIPEKKVGRMDLALRLAEMSFHFSRTGKNIIVCISCIWVYGGSRVATNLYERAL